MPTDAQIAGIDDSNPTTGDGLADNSQQYTGILGNGNTTPLDWFQAGVKDITALAQSAASVITSLGGTKTVDQAGVQQPIKQGGTIEQQNTQASWFHKVPGWGWIALVGAIGVGVAVFLWPKRRRA